MMNRREFGLLPVVALAARLVRAGDETLYDERYRPQFHFSPAKDGRTIPMGWCSTAENTTFSSSTIPLAPMGQHDLGARGQPRPGALEATGERH